MSRALFISVDPFGEYMAGPAVRCRELAAACARAGVEVTVAIPVGSTDPPSGCSVVEFDVTDPGALDALVAETDAVVAQGMTVSRFPALFQSEKPLVVDLYCPFIVENLERDRAEHAGDTVDDAIAQTHLNDLRALNLALSRGDYFLCADERQRLYWLGALTAMSRLTPDAYRSDAELDELIATVPFGCPTDAPGLSEPKMRGALDGVPGNAEILLWGGSLSPWFDITTLIKAIPRVLSERPNARLVLLGAVHPNPDVPVSPVVEEARAQAGRLGLLDRGVHFVSWVPYAKRGGYLTESTLGVSTHGTHLESELAFRTRLVDYCWAGLPMVLSSGDSLGERCVHAGAAKAVQPGDPSALANAIVQSLTDAKWRNNASQAGKLLASRLTWDTVAAPLTAWLARPQAERHRMKMATVVLPPVGGTPEDASVNELHRLRTEAARANELDGRLRAVDRKLAMLENAPGIGRLLRRRRER